MDDERVFIIDDGTEVRQKILATQPIDPSLVVSLHHIMDAKTPDEVLQRTAINAGKICRSKHVTITLKHDDKFLTEAIWYKGALYEMHSHRSVPDVSISTIIAKNNRSVVWSADGGIRNTCWLQDSLFMGSPLLVSEGNPQGTIVIGYNEYNDEVESTILKLELIALSFSTAYKRTLSYEKSFEAGQVVEQERMAQRLHDSVAQGMFAVGLKLKSIVHRDDVACDIVETVEESLEIISSLRSDLKKLVYDNAQQRPSFESVDALLQALIQEHEEAGGPPVALVVNAPENIASILVQAIEIFVHEALLNVRKHAQAHMVVVSVSEQHGAVAISVLDDGVGLHDSADQDAESGLHFGLANLERLALQLRGSLTIGAADEQVGCAVRLRLPLDCAS